VVVLVAACGCGDPHLSGPALGVLVDTLDEVRAEATGPSPAAAAPTCTDPVLQVVDGAERGWICPDRAAADGLTVVDLTDRWTPSVFAAGPDGVAPHFRDTYLALAAEIVSDGDDSPEDHLVELYGVVPAPSAIRRRLADEARHRCHDAIDGAALTTVIATLEQRDTASVRLDDDRRRWLAARLERERARRRLPDLAALAAIPTFRAEVALHRRLATARAGLVAAQQHLVCERLLDARRADGLYTWQTGDAVEMFQRLHFLIPDGRLDADTRRAIAAGSRELDYRAGLRMLRERVADAAGLIEDGSAGVGPVPVMGRMLDPPAMRLARGHAPLASAAVDLVGTTTDVAARELGWTDAAAVLRFLDRHADRPARVALRLPPPPPYHAPHMELAVEIDRGDVWYDPRPIQRRVDRRPALIVYAVEPGLRRPLVRWPTTIGGWADERMPGGWIVQRWKESDVGRRVWRRMYAAPTWYAPPTTPDRALVKNLWNGRWRLKREVFGPGPRSAYGLLMLVHDEPIPFGGQVRYGDHGVRTHGSSTVTSIANGTSHGCHRLFNQLAVRLGSFLLHHRRTVRRGEEPEPYRRLVRYRGLFEASLASRGYLYELDPPVPVNVLPGRIRSVRKQPPRGWAPATAD